MVTTLAKSRGFGTAVNAFLLDTQCQTNQSSFARSVGLSESTLRGYLNGQTSPAWDTLIELAPRLPDAVLFDLMTQLGAGRFVPELIEPSGHEPFCIVGDSIAHIQHAADTSKLAAMLGSDSYFCPSDCEQLDRRASRLIGMLKAFRVGLRAVCGRSLGTLTRRRA